MRSMTFQIDDQSTGNAVPAVVVTITENSDGSVSFTLNVVGSYAGDLRGFFFDLADESLVNTLRITASSAVPAEFRQGDDIVADLGDGSNMQGLLGSDGGFDAGIEIGTAGIGRDDYKSFSFTLETTTPGATLTLEDFSNVDFGVRLTSVGDAGGDRIGSAKILEHTTSAIDVLDVETIATEDGPAIDGDLLPNDDATIGMTRSVVAVDGHAVNEAVTTTIQGTYGTLHINADGTYTYTLDPDNQEVQALAQDQQRDDIVETFSYTATASSEANSSSTDSATLTIRIVGTNDAPVAHADEATTDEDNAVLIDVLANDTDVDFTDTLGVASASVSIGLGSVFVVDNGVLYDPGTAFNYLSVGESADVALAYAISDNHGASADSSVTVTITGVNDGPVANADSAATDEDHTVSIDVLANDTDVDLSHTLKVTSASVTSGLGSTFVAETQVVYDPGTAYQHLAEGESATVELAYAMCDDQGALANSTAILTVTGVNDGPDAVDDVIGGDTAGGMLRVAVIGTANSGLFQAAGQLADSERFSIEADAILMSSYSTSEQWTAALAGYDAVVVGSSGFFDAPEFESSQLFPALRGYVDSGGGVVTTGWFTYDLNNMYAVGFATAADADYVSPVAPGAYTWAGLGDTITVFDSHHPITQDVVNYVVNTFHHEQTSAIDDGAVQLASGPNFSGFDNTAAIAYDEVGGGLTAYVGGLYVANPFTYATLPLRSGILDQIFEQAVAWVGQGGGQTTATNEDHALSISAPTLLANDSDIDVRDVLAVTSYTSHSTMGAAVVENPDGTVRYDPRFAPVIQALHQGQRATDTFSYTITDGHGGTDSATVSLSLIGANDAPTANPDHTSTNEDTAAVGLALLANDVDIDNADTFSLLSFNPESSLGASITWNGATFSYDPTDADELQDLNAGESRLDTFTYTIIDNHGATGTGTVTVEVHGVTDAENLPPIANPDTNDPDGDANTNDGDAVIEDGFAPGFPFGDPFAAGNVLANDFDPDGTTGLPGVVVTAVTGSPGPFGESFFATGAYGTLFLQANGNWNYNLHNFPGETNGAATNALAQGETVFDRFTYTIKDGRGATAESTLSIMVRGTNDAPTLLPIDNTGNVTEDGPSTTGGQLVGSDPDHGATLTYQLPFQSNNGATADYFFSIDEFTLTRMRPGLDSAPVEIFNDEFDNGLPPPNGFFPGTTPPVAAYAAPTTGTFTESGDRARMDGALAQPTFNFGVPLITVGHTALVATSRDPLQPAMGLRPGFDFDATACFDLVVPEFVGQAYGISLNDQRPGFGGDDHIQLIVRRDSPDVVSVVLREGDAISNSITPIDSVALGDVAEGDQIVLHLTHDPDPLHPELTTGVIVGSFELLHADGSVESHVFGNTGRIFGTETPAFAGDNEDFTRATFFATSPAQSFSRTGIYGTVTVDLDGEWRYVLNNADPDTQALAAGEMAVDPFDVLPVDEFRTVTFGNINVTVHGTNDAPVANPDTATTTENEPLSVNVLSNDTDIDHGAVLTLISASTPSGRGTASVVGNQLRFDPGTDFDHLQAGETEVVSVSYSMRDEHDAVSNAIATITVEGADPMVFEDGPRLVRGQLTPPPGLDAESTVWSASTHVETHPAYRFLIDNFRIDRGATPQTMALYFNDDFNDGFPPPATSGLLSETVGSPFVGYNTQNGVITESSGRAVLDGSRSVPLTPSDVPTWGNVARLQTDNNPSNMTRGLKSDDAFRVEGLFDLVTDVEAGQHYGIRLTDAGNLPATDVVQLSVTRRDGVLGVRLAEIDVAAGTTNPLGFVELTPEGGQNQIVLRLTHDPLNRGAIDASFTLLGGDAPENFTFSTQGRIFGIDTPGTADDEVWTRAEFRATSLAGNGAYGTLTLEDNTTGAWTYELSSSPAVQALKQGEEVFDRFEIQATDGAANSGTEVVNIAVVGTNDTPFIGAGPTFATVVENGGALQQFTGRLDAIDIDHDASLTWSLSRSFTGYSTNYQFFADDFTVERNGQVIFLDTFQSALPPLPPAPPTGLPSAPPSAPNFADGSPAFYLTNGTFSEDLAGDGRLTLHGSAAGALGGVGTPELRVGHVATLATNVDPADPSRGLKIDDDFAVHARFDLSFPPLQGQAFGISLSDGTFRGLPPDQLGQDQPNLLVMRDASNHLVLVFNNADSVTDTVHEYARTPLVLGPSDTQIVLRLEHTHGTGIVEASYELRNALNVRTGGGTLDVPGYIFGKGTADTSDDEAWTRPQIVAFGPGDDVATNTLTGFFGTFRVDNSGNWTYELNPGASLNQGQEFFESASVRVTDENGASTSRFIGVSIVGTADMPAVGPLELVGTFVHDVLTGSPQNDLLDGLGGFDTLVGFGGSDRFRFTATFNQPYLGPDTIVDFQRGPLAAGGDVLDIADVIDFVPGGPTPLSNFVRFVDVGGFTTVQINQDGIGGDFLPVASLQGVTGALLNDFLANGNLVV